MIAFTAFAGIAGGGELSRRRRRRRKRRSELAPHQLSPWLMFSLIMQKKTLFHCESLFP
jgi:hypothetical protein